MGSPVRANVGKSYRVGMELDGGGKITSYISVRANLALSHDRTDYKRIEGEEVVSYDNVPLTFSPGIISGYELSVNPIKKLDITLFGKYVGRQYLDLTGNAEKSLDRYFINNLRLTYLLKPKWAENIRLSAQCNDILNIKYASNGYVWDDVPYFYPQAGLNLLTGIEVHF